MFYIWFLFVGCAGKKPVSIGEVTNVQTLIEDYSIDEIAKAPKPIKIPSDTIAGVRQKMWQKHVAEQQENAQS